MRKAVAAIALASCISGPQIRYTTSHGLQVAGEHAPVQPDVELWTAETAEAIGRADCPELAHVTADAVLRVLRYSHDQGVAARAIFVEQLNAYGYASGRILTIGPLERAAAYRHELTHALLDALAPSVPASQHHALMQRCKVP